jgi:hypothetical protein
LEKEDGGIAASSSEKDLHELRIYLQQEEAVIRAEAKQVLNQELIERIEACKSLIEETMRQDSFNAALEAGIVSRVRKQLSACHWLGVRLESWLNTYQPPLSAGGNIGVSAEVQDGMFQNMHILTVGSNDALHRMLSFEKEHALMRTKCTDEAVSRLSRLFSNPEAGTAMRRCGARRLRPAPVAASPHVANIALRAPASAAHQVWQRFKSVRARDAPLPSHTSTPRRRCRAKASALGSRFGSPSLCPARHCLLGATLCHPKL